MCKPVLFFLCLTFLLAVGCGPEKPTSADRATSISQIQAKGKIRIGYAGYPPYLERNPNTGKMSGYSVDLADRIFGPAGISIDWVETTWDTMVQDIAVGKFDLMVEPIFTTIPRALRVGFSRPYSYFGYGVAVVKQAETRFKTLLDINAPSIRLVVTQGVTDDELATTLLSKAKLRRIPGKDISLTLNEVLVGKADVALCDVPTALTFVEAHKGQVKALFMDNPPAVTPASFMTRQDEFGLISFLNTSLDYLEVNGTLESLEHRYKLPSFREKKVFVRGLGLK